jgi:ribonucrease Y
MQGVLYTAVVAAFIVCVYFVFAYSRRTTTSRGRAVRENGTAASADAYAQSARRVAEAEAASIRQLAETEAEAVRRAAASDAEAARRAGEADAASTRAAAENAAAKVDAEVTRQLTDARRTGETEAARLTERLRQAERDLELRLDRAAQAEERLAAETARLAADTAQLTEARNELEMLRREVSGQERALAKRAEALEASAVEQLQHLERIAEMTVDQAKAEVLAVAETAARRDAAVLVRNIENEARAEATERARAIVVESVQRVASEQTSETVVSVLALPSDDMKGRIIGREGRNIRAFESVTGVNVIIDDTPEAVLLSCFDPVRREIGRLALEKLIIDGRIHPHRIEEVYDSSKAEVEELCLRAARDALAEVGISDLDPHLLPTLGRLKYRTSYGQNVLGHLIETAHIAGVMAAELGIEPGLIKRCAFLHDIGKALTHEVEGSHAIVGAELLRRYGESEAVAHAVEAHHNEVPPRTIEAVLTQASDTCSAARPGARRESLEVYVKRLARIEQIATAKAGVEKVFAMQSGREVRVMVQPSEVDDLAAQVIAREIAKQIEDELTYPGQIRVTVVRESRATEVAH